MEIREDRRHDGLADKLYVMADGKDPTTGEKIDVAAQREAIKLLMLYGHGQPAQHVVLEGAIRNEVISIEPRAARPTMSLEDINARRAQLRALGVKPKIIDVDEQPLLEAGEEGGGE